VRNGWRHTGDLADVDDEGYYPFVGRTDDLISSAGHRIGPGEIEECPVRPGRRAGGGVRDPGQGPRRGDQGVRRRILTVAATGSGLAFAQSSGNKHLGQICSLARPDPGATR